MPPTTKQYQQLVELGKQVLTELDIDSVLRTAMDHLITMSGAERGLIILFDEKGECLVQTARQLDQADIEHPKFEISRTIIEKTKITGKTFHAENAMEDVNLKKSASVEELRLLSVICLPLVHQQRVFGVIYLDNRTVLGAFQQDTFEFVASFADFISLAAHQVFERQRLTNQQHALEDELRTNYDFNAIIGHSPKMLNVLLTISQVAVADVPVLIQGESGTGKELVARAIHYNSPRRSKPLLSLNCAAFPDELLESEFFGHEKGAFTGAMFCRKGKFEEANGGTMFLDEIDDMSPALQVKLLRVLQWGEYTPLGSDVTKKCDVRIVAACKSSLQEMVKNGTFREDLYYRLHVFDIFLPPLRERPEDILELAEHFVKHHIPGRGKDRPTLARETAFILKNYAFPGNVRELENIIQHAAIVCTGKTIEPQHLPPALTQSQLNFNTEDTSRFPTFKQAKEELLDDFERQYLLRVLHESGGVIKKAAALAGMHTKNFHQKLLKYNIRGKDVKS